MFRIYPAHKRVIIIHLRSVRHTALMSFKPRRDNTSTNTVPVLPFHSPSERPDTATTAQSSTVSTTTNTTTTTTMSLPVPTTGTASTFPSPRSMDPRELQALDAPLIALTQQCNGDLRRLLFAFFSFLNRRTDFYLVPSTDGDDIQQGMAKMGFKEGDAEKLLLASFRQFPLRRIPSRKQGGGSGGTGGAGTGSKPAPSTPGMKETPKEDSRSVGDPDDATGNTSTTKSTTGTTSKEEKSEGSSRETKKTAMKTNDSNNSNNMDGVEYNEEGLQIPVGNGGSTPQYKWTQTLEETTVLIGIPDKLRAKDLDVKISSTKLSVKSKVPLQLPSSSHSTAAATTATTTATTTTSSSSSPHTFVDGELSGKVRPDESTWTVEGGVMIVTLDKYQKKFWSNVLVGDPPIDTEQVDSRRHISDYDEITQAQIRKTIFDQTQYHKGLPSSDEILGNKESPSKATSKSPAILDTASSDPIPPLPPGVEFIDKKKLDEVDDTNNKK